MSPDKPSLSLVDRAPPIDPATVGSTSESAPVQADERVTPNKAQRLAEASKRRHVLRWLLDRAIFVALVLGPISAVIFYYVAMSSDQYRSQMRFAVRGTNQSPFASFGLPALPGNTVQAADAYIVIDYINSKQIVLDVREKLGIDLRSFYARPEIDSAYRIDANLPIDQFVEHWRWMVDAGFNSTTSITTVEVSAFTAADSQAITKAVLKVAAGLVNDLSTEAQTQLIDNAEREVMRTENRLLTARKAIELFRNVEQQLNPAAVAEGGQKIVGELQSSIVELQARRSALISSVDVNSPSVRVLDRQLVALRIQLAEQLKLFGTGTSVSAEDGNRNLSTQISEYGALALEEEFAKTAYTSALASLETSQAEARRAERYFAIIVEPTLPEISLHPTRMINVALFFALFVIVWMITQLIVQAVRDHAK